jgi:hypothetical protein
MTGGDIVEQKSYHTGRLRLWRGGRIEFFFVALPDLLLLACTVL